MWAYDFVHDRCANGATLKCPAVVDEYTRLCLAIEVGSRIDSQRVLDVLTRLLHRYGIPSYIRSDNGPEFIAKAIKGWLAAHRIAEVCAAAMTRPAAEIQEDAGEPLALTCTLNSGPYLGLKCS
jgi:transposase InsO family protein